MMCAATRSGDRTRISQLRNVLNLYKGRVDLQYQRTELSDHFQLWATHQLFISTLQDTTSVLTVCVLLWGNVRAPEKCLWAWAVGCDHQLGSAGRQLSRLLLCSCRIYSTGNNRLHAAGSICARLKKEEQISELWGSENRILVYHHTTQWNTESWLTNNLNPSFI